jgi:PIN domain nuclease of toxin-antitoxin system
VTALLLDTHAFVWATSEPGRLSTPARERIADRGTQILVSAATAWEVAIKHRAGRWPEAEPLLAAFEEIVDRLGAQHLDMRWSHARRAGGLRWDHPDPFDRMLAAQAMLVDAALVTGDEAFAAVAGLDLLW